MALRVKLGPKERRGCDIDSFRNKDVMVNKKIAYLG